MENFCDFDFYKTEYLAGKPGIIPEGEFPIYARDATLLLREEINMDLLDELDEMPEELQMAACKITELMYKASGSSSEAEDEANSSSASSSAVPIGVSSERVGEYSVTYSGNSAKDVQEESERQIRNVIKRWLGPTGLLYKGAYLHVRK